MYEDLIFPLVLLLFLIFILFVPTLLYAGLRKDRGILSPAGFHSSSLCLCSWGWGEFSSPT